MKFKSYADPPFRQFLVFQLAIHLRTMKALHQRIANSYEANLGFCVV